MKTFQPNFSKSETTAFFLFKMLKKFLKVQQKVWNYSLS